MKAIKFALPIAGLTIALIYAFSNHFKTLDPAPPPQSADTTSVPQISTSVPTVPNMPPPSPGLPGLMAEAGGNGDGGGETDSVECVGYWGGVRKLDLKKIQAGTEVVVLPGRSTCQRRPMALAGIEADLERACDPQLLADKPANSEERLRCADMVQAYQWTLADWTTRKEKLENIRDVKLLSEKMFGAMMVNPPQVGPVAERILKLKPDNYPAAKIAATSRVYEMLQKNSPEALAAAKATMARADRLSPPFEKMGWEQARIMMAIHTNDMTFAQQRIDQLRRDDPSSGMPEFLEAVRNQREGGSWEKSQELLEKALAKERARTQPTFGSASIPLAEVIKMALERREIAWEMRSEMPFASGRKPPTQAR